MSDHDGHRRAAAVGRLAGEQPIEGAAERINVGAMIGRVWIFSLFGCHVVARAHHLIGDGQLPGIACLPIDPGQPEVEDLDDCGIRTPWPGLFMNRSAFFKTCTWKRSYVYLAQNTEQISRNALASGLCHDCCNRGLAPCG